MNDMKEELAYLEKKLRHETGLYKSKKTTEEDRAILGKSIMIRQERICEIKNMMQGITKKHLRQAEKISKAYGQNVFQAADKGLISRGDGSLGKAWETKKDTYWSK